MGRSVADVLSAHGLWWYTQLPTNCAGFDERGLEKIFNITLTGLTGTKIDQALFRAWL